MEHDENYIFHISDIPADVLPTDEINIHRSSCEYKDETYENSQLVITREREETDEEYENRMAQLELDKETLRKKKWHDYLRLQQYFFPLESGPVKIIYTSYLHKNNYKEGDEAYLDVENKRILYLNKWYKFDGSWVVEKI